MIMKKLKNWGFVLMFVMGLSLTACGGDGGNGDSSPIPSLDKSSITLYVGESSVLTYSGGNCSWSSENPLIASVRDGIVKAEHVGTTTIYANNVSCSVTVKPKHLSYTEPYMGFGSSMSAVKRYMSGYTISKELSTGISYYGRGKVDQYIYGFENNALSMSIMQTSLVNGLGLSDFLIERYITIDYDKEDSNNYNIYLVSPDKKIVVLFQVSSTYGCVVAYSKAPETNSASRRSALDNKELMVDLLHSLIIK